MIRRLTAARVCAALFCAALLFVGAVSVASAEEAKKPETRAVEIDALKSEVPTAWEKQQPKNQFRMLQYRVPKAEGDPADAEFYVSKLSGGGSVEDNLKRWANQFADAKVGETGKAERDGLKIYTTEIAGTYLDRPFPASPKVTERKDYKLLGAIVETSDGTLYIRVTGPAKTIDAHKAGWENLIKNLKP
jgi:hypothetical protein